MNLVVNAADAMPGGGKLTIATENAALDDSHADYHADFAAGDYVVLTVTDTGVGMDAETVAQIFEPFFTTKEEGRGTGLGLASVDGIVKQHGGFIWVYSEPGDGSVFKIYLPRIDEERADEELAPFANERLEGRETVLVVDNNETVVRAARRILQGFGYRVLEATEPGRALELLGEQRETVHLLLTDAIMPGMSGPELADRIRALRPEIKILIMSGYSSDAEALNRAMRKGAAFLPKPFTAQGLAAKVRQILDSTG